jgi:chromosome segregation ATPase
VLALRQTAAALEGQIADHAGRTEAAAAEAALVAQLLTSAGLRVQWLEQALADAQAQRLDTPRSNNPYNDLRHAQNDAMPLRPQHLALCHVRQEVEALRRRLEELRRAAANVAAAMAALQHVLDAQNTEIVWAIGPAEAADAGAGLGTGWHDDEQRAVDSGGTETA